MDRKIQKASSKKWNIIQITFAVVSSEHEANSEPVRSHLTQLTSPCKNKFSFYLVFKNTSLIRCHTRDFVFLSLICYPNQYW